MNLKHPRLLALIAVIALATGAAVLVMTSPHLGDEQAGRERQLYTCGMHPQVIQDHPGNCPICGMKLNPIRKQVEGTAASASSSQIIAIDPVTSQNMGIRTGIVALGPLRRTIRTVATIDFDETTLADVTTKFRGWIEKLYVDATGKQVHRGEPLFEIYAPDLYNAQIEYLLSLNQSGKLDASADSIKVSALTKLKFFDISDEQIAGLEKTKQASKTLRVSAPRDGIVVDKLVVEGQMVEAGMKLYRLADLSLVWVQSQVYEQDLPFIRLGQEAVVKLSYFPDREFRGRVTYIYPTMDEKTRTARVRMEFHNPGFFLKPGMYTTAELNAELAVSALLVPDSAVLRSGEKNTVFVALEGGKFEPRIVTLGPRSENNQYQVYTGLKEGERVVTSGQFMLDSESQLREAIQKMQSPVSTPAVEPTGPAATPVWGSEHAAQSADAKDGEAVTYICPMPEHVSIKYNHPGKCPICGMTLVPVSEATLRKLQPGGKVLYYTCPMPEHSNLRLNEPGKCPKCGMTLIPIMEVVPAQAVANPPVPSTLYTCPMKTDADVVSDHPGNCPKCGMKLVETGTVAHGKIAEENWRQQHAAVPRAPNATIRQP